MTNDEVNVTLDLKQPNGTDLLQTAINLLNMVSLSGASTGVINTQISCFFAGMIWIAQNAMRPN